MSFFENTRKPVGFGGEIMVAMMNLGHRALARWGMGFLTLPADGKVLDCGCGGGANIQKLLKKCPQGVVKGIDYSPVSVTKTRELNEQAVNDGRCVIWQGSVEQIIFAKDWFDVVTAFETVYFWPNLHRCFREVYRVLKSGGTFLICNECSGDTDKGDKWTRKIGGMTIYKDVQLKALLEQAGFRDIQVHISIARSLPKVLSVDRGSRSFLIQKPGCHVPQGLLHGARLICKAFRCCGMAEAAV